MSVIYSLRDLGEDFAPWNLNRQGDLVGQARGGSPRVLLADGTAVTPPPEIVFVDEISDSRLVLGEFESRDYVLFDLVSSTMEPIHVPSGFYVLNASMNNNGDVAGSAGRGSKFTDDWRGFIRHRDSGTLTWVFPSIMPLPPGATPYLSSPPPFSGGRQRRRRSESGVRVVGGHFQPVPPRGPLGERYRLQSRQR